MHDDEGNRECTIVESETVLIETTVNGNEQDRLARAFANVTPSSGRVCVAVRSTSILQASDPHYLERLFPHLFTFGIGGFSASRHHRYSLRGVVLHYLNLSSNRFAEDAMFKLVMFDYLSTKRVKTGVFLRVGREPSLAATAMRVTPAQLKAAMRSREQQRAAWKMGRSYTPSPQPTAASALLKSITVATSKMWGSNEENVMARKVDAMTIRYGAPSVFWTLTPNPDCSLVCAFWTGQELPNGRPDELAQCGELNMPCSSEMSRLIMGNTVVQAHYYKVCCHLLIDVLFGWDTKPTNRSGDEESSVLWRHSSMDWSNKAASLFTITVLPGLLDYPRANPTGNIYLQVQISGKNSIDILVAVPIPNKFKHLLKSSVPAPIVATCDACEQAFTERDIVHSIIDEQWRTLDNDKKAVSTPEAVDSIRLKFGGLSTDPATADIQMSQLLLKDQLHTWTHSHSCIKGHSGTKCRYNFFRPLVPTTTLNEDDEMVYQRRLGNQWLNPFIELWRRIMHFNMDARVLWSGQGLQATRYALQYALKRQTVLDNVAVVGLAFQRRVSRETALQTTEYAKGIGRLLALPYSSSGVMEIGAPLATVILFEGEAVTFSCDFERLVLLEGLNQMNNCDVEANVVWREHQMVTETCISKYIGRLRCLENFSWYDYCSWVSHVGVSSNSAIETCTFDSSDIELLGEHLKEHKYRILETPRVPQIVGPRLPDSLRLEDDDYGDQTELYYRIAALLYCPFRDVKRFLDIDGSARSHFDKWKPNADKNTACALS